MRIRNVFRLLLPILALGLLFAACARMGSPDGGWYDETPPRVVSASPADKGVGVTQKKVTINFSEFIKLENASEKVVISPPQMEQPTIKASGKNIIVELVDSLKPDITYTIDFSDAISDNNEGNPLGNYTYSFSTGNQIDTLEVSGTVLNAQDLEPIKGILVGLYKEDTLRARGDSLPTFTRVSRTDSRGHFVIRGIAPGRYTVGAVQDMDGDFRFSQRGEKMAFSYDVIVPSCFPDRRQDTLWIDENHIRDIKLQPYTHFMPDNIVLRAFDHMLTDRSFLKAERLEADHFTLFFTAPVIADSLRRFKRNPLAGPLPVLEGLNFNADEAFVIEPSLMGDTVTYWLRDTALVNRDTLHIAMSTLLTDTTGMLNMSTDTLEVLAKVPYAKRQKEQQKVREDWEAKIAKQRKRAKEGEEIDTIMPQPYLEPKYGIKQKMAPDATISIQFPKPMKKVDTTAVHLYVEQDSLWYSAPFVMERCDSMPTMRNWQLYSEWIPGARYSLEIDSTAFEDIYGLASQPYKAGMEISELDAYASLFVKVSPSYDCPVVVEMLNSSGNPVRKAVVENGTAEFYYIDGGKYYLRAFIDRNANGVWDSGDYYADRQPEEVYYMPEEVECKVKWDITKAWNLTALPLDRQKAEKITKQKGEKEKKRTDRNIKRAKDMDIPLPDYLRH